jgi:hypothetical protein
MMAQIFLLYDDLLYVSDTGSGVCFPRAHKSFFLSTFYVNLSSVVS